MSSPHVNNIIIFGGLLCYIKVVVDTLDSRFVGLETYGRFCNVSCLIKVIARRRLQNAIRNAILLKTFVALLGKPFLP